MGVKFFNKSDFTLYVGESGVVNSLETVEFKEITQEIANLERDGFAVLEVFSVEEEVAAEEVVPVAEEVVADEVALEVVFEEVLPAEEFPLSLDEMFAEVEAAEEVQLTLPIVTEDVVVPVVAETVDLAVETVSQLEVNPADPAVEATVIDVTGVSVITVETSADAPVVAAVEDGVAVIGAVGSDTVTITMDGGEPIVIDTSTSDTVTITGLEADTTVVTEDVAPVVEVAPSTEAVVDVPSAIDLDIDGVIAALNAMKVKY